MKIGHYGISKPYIPRNLFVTVYRRNGTSSIARACNVDWFHDENASETDVIAYEICTKNVMTEILEHEYRKTRQPKLKREPFRF